MNSEERNVIMDCAASLKDAIRGITCANGLIGDGAESSTLNALEKNGLSVLVKEIKEDSDAAYNEIQGIFNVLDGILPEESNSTL